MTKTMNINGDDIEFIEGDGFIIITEISRVMDDSETGYALVKYYEKPVRTGITSTSGGCYSKLVERGLWDKMNYL